MILQALVEYYNALAARGKISLPGWCDAKVSYALHIEEDGTLAGVLPLKYRPEGGKKEIPQILRVPQQVKKTSGVNANFLCENSSYFLGVDGKGKPERTLECFEAARLRHEQLLAGVDSPAARAILAYFARWQPAEASSHPALEGVLEDILKGANLVFWVNGEYAHKDPAIQAAWQARRAQGSGAATGRCLVTGEVGPIAVLHPSIKGVRGAQSSGASLVSFNADAFESYGKEMRDDTGQGYNSPVSEAAAFAYGTALNYLVSDRNHMKLIGDTTVVYWAEGAEPLYQDIFTQCLFGAPAAADNSITQNDLDGIMAAIARRDPVNVEGIPLNPDNRFYVLGLAPSAARLSVRFFLQNSFGGFLQNIQRHYKRLDIPRPVGAQPPVLLVWYLLNETVNQNSRDKASSPLLTGGVMRAILQDAPYPAALYQNVMLRINAERDVGWRKAAILKAFLLKNHPARTGIKEEITMPIEYASESPAFVLGCLLALLEEMQETAIEGIKQTLVDKCLSTACATPALVFDGLLEKSNYHLGKIRRRSGEKAYIFRATRLQRVLKVFHEKSPSFPESLDHVERGDFMVGYYLQRQQFFMKKDKSEEKESAEIINKTEEENHV